VELVRLYSNPKARLETLQHLLHKAMSAPRLHGRPVTRQNQIRLKARDANALGAAYRDGQTVKELAQQYGVHRTTVTELLRRHGVERPHVGLANEQVLEACHLYSEGWSLARLGRRFSVDSTTVWRALRAAGMTMRSPHERRK
jgi:lambda repressor-like predicted transcriptional regulator